MNLRYMIPLTWIPLHIGGSIFCHCMDRSYCQRYWLDSHYDLGQAHLYQIYYWYFGHPYDI